MPDMDMILAFLAVPVFLVATVANLLAARRNGRKHFGPTMIFILIAAISLWNAISYLLLAINVYPEMTPPLSVVLLRPVNLFTGFVFTVIPSYLFTRHESRVDSERIEEALTNSRDCQEKLHQVQLRLLNQEQAVEVYQTAYLTMKGKYEAAKMELEARNDER